MPPALIPEDEKDRLNAVRSLNILDTPPEERFDILTREAVEKFQVPISTISIIDADREWFKSCQGVKTREGARAISFCGHALLSRYILIVENTLNDPRFADNPAVVGEPYIKFYAGMELTNKKTSKTVGVFCIKDTKPRKMSTKEIGTFIQLARRAEEELNR